MATQSPAVTFALQQRVDDVHKIEALASSRIVKVDHILFMNQFEKIFKIHKMISLVTYFWLKKQYNTIENKTIYIPASLRDIRI